MADNITKLVQKRHNRDNAWRSRENPRRLSLKDERQKVLDMLPHQADRGLDLGCGRGDYLEALSKISNKVVGLDLAQVLLWDAKRKISQDKTDLVLADATLLPFSPESFELILAIQVMGFIPQLDVVLKEAHRVLKDDGILVLSEPNALAFEQFTATFIVMEAYLMNHGFGSLVRNFFKFFQYDRYFWIREQGHCRAPYFWLKKLLTENGFEIQNVRGVNFMWLNSRLTGKLDSKISDFLPFKYFSRYTLISARKIPLRERQRG